MATRRARGIAAAAALFVLIAGGAAALRLRPGPGRSAASIATARELGVALAEEMRLDEAEQLWRAVVASPHATPSDRVQLAAVAFGRWVKGGGTDTPQQVVDGWVEEAMHRCAGALALDESLAAAHYIRGVLAREYAAGLVPAQGLLHLRRAVELAPDDDGARFHLAGTLEEVEERAEALSLYEQLVAKGKEFAGVYYGPSLYRNARLVLHRGLAGDRERALALHELHRALPPPASDEQEKRDMRLGSLGRVRLPARLPAAAAAGPPASPVAFERAARPLLVQAGPVDSIDVGDFDGDGRDDVAVAGAAGLFVALAQPDGSFREQGVSPDRAARVVVVELENEGGAEYGISRASLLALAEEGASLFSPREDASFVDDSAKLPPLPGVVDVEPVDFDHDGHLDLLFATREGVRLVRNLGVRRDGEGRRAEDESRQAAELSFVEVTQEAGLRDVAAGWAAIEDFDSDQDVDLLIGGPGARTLLFSNLRRGRFERLGSDRTALPDGLATEPVLGDADGDGHPDVILLGAAVQVLRGRGDLTFSSPEPLAGPEAAGAGAAERGELLDVDLDGELDLAGSGAGVGWWWPAAGRAGASALALPGRHARHAPPLLVDLDRDLALDVLAPGEAGVERFRGTLPDPPRRARLTLRGRKDNHGGIGTVVEVRVGSRYQRRFVRRSTQLFGFARDATPVIRLIWPNGVFQYPLQTANTLDRDLHEAASDPRLELPPDLTKDVSGVLEQKKGPPGSCPFLYSWDGSRYVFVTDVLGATPLGLPVDEECFVAPDHDELVRMTSRQLAPADGEYRLQITEELRETTYLDRAQLWVVDHAIDVEVHPEERFCFPPFPPQRIHAMRDLRPLARAVDQEGRDWTGPLAAQDDVPATPFTPLPEVYRGIATRHSLELTLPDAARSARRVRLLMTGWLHWGDSSVNLAAARNGGVEFLPPVVAAPAGVDGGWRDCGPPVGFPAGKTKTMVLDVTSMVDRGDPRLRITSTLELYWDEIRVALDDGDAPVAVTRLEPTRARLWHRGFSRPLLGRRSDQPERFDWERLEPFPRWNQHAGMLTRLGDVRPLLGAADDRFVILSAGDAIDLRFDASALEPPGPGMARTFLLLLDGWAKDGDPNTAHSQTVEPLPFHGMSAYPYRADERHPDDPEHARYRAEWNTRRGRRLVEPLAPAPGAKPGRGGGR